MIEVNSVQIAEGVIIFDCHDTDNDVRDNGRFGVPVQRELRFALPTDHPRYRAEIEDLLNGLKDLAESVYQDFDRSPVYVPEDDDQEEMGIQVTG